MIFACGEIVDRHFHLVQIDPGTCNFHLSFGELVVQIAVAQIERMIGRRHAGCVGIPVEDVERHWLLAAHVIVDDVGPDQIVRTQHIEGVGHARGFQVALLFHVRLKLADALLVDEHHEVARVGEIDLRGKQCRRLDAALLFCGQIGEGDREQRSADAIADGVNLLLPSDRFNRIQCGDHAFAHILFKTFGCEPGVRIDPRDHEHRDALIDAPFDEGFFWRKVENVKLVYPWRHDQQRELHRILGSRFVLDELH